MKYIIVRTAGREHMLLFPESMDHSLCFSLQTEMYPDTELVSAGKIHIEPAECYPGQHYVSITPGSVTLKLEYKTREACELAIHQARQALPEVLDLVADEDKVYGSFDLRTFHQRKGERVRLKLDYLPPDAYCPRARVTLTGLKDAYLKLRFWQAWKRF